MKFGMFFVGEYLGLVLVSSLITVLFFGGWIGRASCHQLSVRRKVRSFHCFYFTCGQQFRDPATTSS